jgi:transposase InsO family protein
MTEADLFNSLTVEQERQKEENSASAYFTKGGEREKPQGGKGRDSFRHGNQRGSKGAYKPMGEWGKKGMAPQGHCHGCHKKGHSWMECRSRPKGAVPAFLLDKDKKGRSGDAAHVDGAKTGTTFGELAAVTPLGEASFAATNKKEGWWIDSGASHNFTHSLHDFIGPLRPPEVQGVRVGDGRGIPVLGMGEVAVRGHEGRLVTLTKVHYVPTLHTKLLSANHLTAKGFEVLLTGTRCEVTKPGKGLFFVGHKEGGHDHSLVRVKMEVISMAAKGSPLPPGGEAATAQASDATGAAMLTALDPVTLAHQRLGHVAPSTIEKMVKAEAITGLDLGGKASEMPKCEVCMLGKAVRQPFPEASSTRIEAKLDLVSADLWGPTRVATVGDKCIYVLSLVDHATRMVWAFTLPNKESATVKGRLDPWRLKVERQADRKLKTLRADNGTEFLGDVQAWLTALGITRQRTTPYSPAQNGVVERWHRTMGEGIRALLLSSGLPVSFWGEALRHVVWVYNRTAHSALGGLKTPWEAWTGHKPHLGMLRVWGTMGCVHLPPPDAKAEGKLGLRGAMCVTLGVDNEAKAWRMLESLPHEGADQPRRRLH